MDTLDLLEKTAKFADYPNRILYMLFWETKMPILNTSKKTVLVKCEPDTKIKSQKTRGYMMGKKMSTKQMKTEIIRLAKTHKIFEIVKITGKNRRTIERYLKDAKDTGEVLTTASGRVTLPEEELAKRKYEKLSRNDLYENYQPVKNWVDKRTAEAKGNKTKLIRLRNQLGRLKVVFDSTRLNPYVLLSSGEDGTSYGGLESVMSAFSMAMVEQRVVYQTKQKQPDPENIASSFREHLMACRSFATYNGVTIPKMTPEHILSGKKVGFGQYAHIKLSQAEINLCVRKLIEKHGEDSFEVASFVFYYLTGTRNKSIYGVKTSSCELNSEGWITCRVYESKQKFTWKKYIPNDNPHFDIIQKWIAKRKTDGKVFLFSEDGKYTEDFIASLRNSYKEIYKSIGILEEYFYGHAIHVLRHISAHYWLERTNLNHAVVAKIVGWKDVQTLIQCYGEITDSQIFKIVINGAVA